MYKKILLVLFPLIMVGCASVPLETVGTSNEALEFNPPTEGMAGVYIYRNTSFTGAVKNNVWVDGECVGETAPFVFFYIEVKPGVKVVATESLVSPNEISVEMDAGKLYFIDQDYWQMRTTLNLVSEERGKKAVSKLKLAKGGICTQNRPWYLK